MKKFTIGLITAASLFLLSACGAPSSKTDTTKADTDKISIMTTFYPMYEFTKQVAGDTAEVSLLIPAGTEPHDFEPSARQMASITEADVFVYSSSDMEIFIDSMKESIDTSDTLMIEAAKGIERLAGTSEDTHDHETDDEHDHEEESGHSHSHEYDPHVWLDPVLAQKQVTTIATALGEKYPELKATFEKNAVAYNKQLATLDQEFAAAFEGAENRTFVTQHAAFAYLADRYGLIQESISGISPDQEPTPSRLAELKHFVNEHGTTVIYFEENASSKVAETLAKETGVSLKVLNPLESLTNEQKENGANYLSIMRENLDALKYSIK